ncbi:MAG: energy transducer TonB [Nitrospinota bacterium]
MNHRSVNMDYNIKWLVATLLSVTVHLGLVIGLVFATSWVDNNYQTTKNAIVNLVNSQPLQAATTTQPDSNKDSSQNEIDNKFIDKQELARVSSDSIDTNPTSNDDTLDQAAAAAYNQYLSEVKYLIEKNRFYPIEARRRNLEAEFEVSFIIGTDRMPANIETVNAPAMLRSATQEAIYKSAPFPAPKESDKLPFPVKFTMEYKLLR